jgi:hypothetical protein
MGVLQKYKDSTFLKESGSYANSIYLSGYCVELSLKYAIARHLKWDKFYTEQKFKVLKVHDLDFLVSFTGQALEIKKMPAWQIVKEWDEQKRYKNPASSTEHDATPIVPQY